MPLERCSDRSFIGEPKGVRFGMREGQRIVLCILTREALVGVFGSSDQEQWENIFKANRPMIEPSPVTSMTRVKLVFLFM